MVGLKKSFAVVQETFFVEIKFACVDGPEFDGHLVDFDQAMKRSAMYRTEEGRAMLKLQDRKSVV